MYAILGITGKTGGAAAETLLSRGAKVRAIVRSAEKGEAWRSRGVEVAVATLDDEAALTAALSGVEGAYLLLPPDMATSSFIDDRIAWAETLARAARAAKLPHLVLLSSIGAQHAEGTGVIRAVHHGEQILGKLQQTATTFVRAAYFIENWGGVLGAARGDGVLPTLFTPIDKKIPMVATADIGRVAAEALLDGPRGQRVIELEGPERYAPTDIAAIVGEQLGRSITVTPVPAEVQVGMFLSFGMSQDVSELMAELNRGVENGKVAFAGGAAEHQRGKVSAREVLTAMLT